MSFSKNPSQSQSQSNSHSPQEKQQSQPTYAWSAHIYPLGQSPSPFPRHSHALSTTATAAGELFLFGGDVNNSWSGSNDLYMISTRDFSTTPLKTSGDVPNPRFGHRAAFTGTTLLIWGGRVTSVTGIRRKKKYGFDDSLYLLNLGTSDIFMSRPTPTDHNFFHSQYRESGPASWSMVPSLVVVSIIP